MGKYPVATNGFIEIMGIEYGINDSVIWRYAGERKLHTAQIYYAGKGGSTNASAYFNANGRRQYLMDFMKY